MHKLASYAIMIICILVIYLQNITIWNDKKIYFNVCAKADISLIYCAE